MIGYVLRRAAYGLGVLWLASTAVFVLVHVASPDPARVLGGPHATAETVALIRKSLGLDQPLVVQYGRFLGRLLRGDLGESYVNGSSVGSLIAAGLPTTLALMLGGAVLWLAGGIGAGLLAATRPRLDRLVTFLVLLGLSVPAFTLGLLLLFVFFSRLGDLGVHIVEPGPPLEENFPQRMILPWITLALLQLATYARLTRVALLDVLDKDFVRTARAKGLAEAQVVVRHGMRAAMTPLVSQLGVDAGALIGGVVVTEKVFGLQGIGQLVVQSIVVGDAPVVLGVVLLTACCVVVAGLIVDLAYATLDPRVRLT